MPAISVQITRYIDDHFPGFVECVIVDAHGTTHTFIEKAPCLSVTSLSAKSTYPCSGELMVEICREWQDETGFLLAVVNTGKESSDGATEFTVLSSQLKNRGACA
jgi:hypothetical protein